MRNIHISSLVVVAVLSFGCSAAGGADLIDAAAAGSGAGEASAAGQAGAAVAGASGGATEAGGAPASGGAPSASGGAGGTATQAGAGGAPIASQAGAAGAGGNPGSGGAFAGAGTAGTTAGAGGASVAGSGSAGAAGGPLDLEPFPGCAAGFTSYNVPAENCIKIVGRFVVGDTKHCDGDYSSSSITTCATWTASKNVVAMVRAQPGYSYTATRFVGACPVPCTN